MEALTPRVSLRTQKERRLFPLNSDRLAPVFLIVILGVVPSCAQEYSSQPEAGPCTAAAAHHLAHAYNRSNCVIAYYLGSLESYVAANAEHFTAQGDVVGCGTALATAMSQKAIENFDPNWMREQEALRSRLGAMGISPGPAQASPEASLYAMARRIAWLTDVLPAAAAGDYRPLRTPVTEEQRMEAFACQMMQNLMQDPFMAASMDHVAPEVRQIMNSQYEMIVAMAMSINY